MINVSQSIQEARDRPCTVSVVELPDWLLRYADAMDHGIDVNPATMARYLKRAAVELKNQEAEIDSLHQLLTYGDTA